MATWNYFHTLDPFIIHFTGNFGIRWYSMAYIMGFFTGWLILKWLIKINATSLLKKDAVDFIVWLAFGVILGGRMGYAVFYSPDIFMEFDSQFPFWELLKVHHGGLASHGGIIGLTIATVLFARSRGFSIYHCLDMTVLGGFGIFFGRIANFINGELFGRTIEGKTLLAVQFPQEMLLWVSQKKIEYLQDLSTAVSYLKTEINANTWREWIYQFESTGNYKAQIYSVIYSLIQACEKGNKEVITALKAVISYRHPSQIYQALLEGLLPLLVVFFLWRKKTLLKPGMIAGIWAVCYGLMRILGEQFRMPDAHLGFEALGMTRGQWLSILMLAGIAIYFMLLFKSQKAEKSQT